MIVVAVRYLDSKTFAAENGLPDYFVSLLHAAGHSSHFCCIATSLFLQFLSHFDFVRASQATPIGQLIPSLPLQRGPESNA
jgi:hypothetical protein